MISDTPQFGVESSSSFEWSQPFLGNAHVGDHIHWLPRCLYFYDIDLLLAYIEHVDFHVRRTEFRQ